MITVIKTQLKEHRGKQRFWLEGNKLLRGGINPQDKLRVKYNKSRKVAVFKVTANDGDCKVSERKAKAVPVLDFKDDKFAELFSASELKVTVRKSKIYVRIHHTEIKKNERVERFKKVLNVPEDLQDEYTHLVNYLNIRTGTKIQIPEASETDVDFINGYAEKFEQNKHFMMSALMNIKAFNPLFVSLKLAYSEDGNKDELKEAQVLASVLISSLRDLGYVVKTNEGIRADKVESLSIIAVGEGLEEAFYIPERSLGISDQVYFIDVQDGITYRDIETKRKEREDRLISDLLNGKKQEIGSLAHGAGILDLAAHNGLNQAGIDSRLAFAVEIEDKYMEVSYRNNPVWDEDSIGIISPMQLVDLSTAPKVSGLIAGLPCVGASLSGRSKGKLAFAEAHSSAGTLFLTFLDFVMACNPCWTTIENVPPYINTKSFELLIEYMELLGYDSQLRILGGNEFGGLEDRKRLALFCSSSGLDLGFDLDQVTPIRVKEDTLGEILEDIPDDSSRWKDFTYLAEKEKRDLAAGKGFKRQLVDASASKVGVVGSGYHKCRSTEPMILRDDGKQRLLTPIEHAKVKTVDPKLVSGVSDTVAHQVLGNSIVRVAFEAMYSNLGKCLKYISINSNSIAISA